MQLFIISKQELHTQAYCVYLRSIWLCTYRVRKIPRTLKAFKSDQLTAWPPGHTYSGSVFLRRNNRPTFIQPMRYAQKVEFYRPSICSYTSMYSSADRTMDRNQLFARRVGCWGTSGKFKRLDLGPLWSADTEKLVECKMVIWFHSKGDDVGGYFF